MKATKKRFENNYLATVGFEFFAFNIKMENPSSTIEDLDAEIMPEDYPTYDASFKIIVIGDQGKK